MNALPLNLLELYGQMPTFALIVARLAGFTMFQPLLSSESVPTNVRVLLVLALGLLICPFVAAPAAGPESLAALVVGMGGELILGALFGQLMMMCFMGLQLAGTMIAQESGLAFGAVINPATAEEESVLSTMYVQLAMVVFLVAGGHRVIVGATLDSFQSVPLLQVGDVFTRGAGVLGDAVTAGLAMGVRIAAPSILAMFLVNAGLGIISRTMPQFNVVSLGFASKSLLSFGMMAVTLPTAINLFTAGLDEIVGWVDQLLSTHAARHLLAPAL